MTLLDRLALSIGEEIDRQDPKCQSVLNLTQVSKAALRVVCDALREPDEKLLALLRRDAWKLGDDLRRSDLTGILRALATHLQGEGE